MVGDVAQSETARAVVGSELMFCNDHNLLMYPKSIMAVPRSQQVPAQRKNQLQPTLGLRRLTPLIQTALKVAVMKETSCPVSKIQCSFFTKSSVRLKTA